MFEKLTLKQRGIIAITILGTALIFFILGVMSGTYYLRVICLN